MENLIITGTRSISIADRAVAATLGSKVSRHKFETPTPEGITEAYVGDSPETVATFGERLQSIKKAWGVLYKTLDGEPTAAKTAKYHEMVIQWAIENGAEDFTLATKTKAVTVKEKKQPKAKKTGAQATTKVTKPIETLNLGDEFGEESPAVAPEETGEVAPEETVEVAPEKKSKKGKKSEPVIADNEFED